VTHDDRDLTWEVQRHDHRTLFVGLGGTGKEIISRVKARLKALGGGEVSPRVGFLAIDVSFSPPKVPELRSVLSQDELCHPSQNFLPSYIQAEVRKHIEQGGELAWVGERIPPGQMTLEYNSFMMGTERYRQAGLLAYLWEEHSMAGVSGALRLAIAGVTQAVRTPTALSVFIIGSLCGGFGSGALIDVAYLARSIGLEYAAGSCDVSAVLVLPGVFRRYVDDATYSDLQRNALAALTELDYFMYPQGQRVSRTCDPNDVNWPLRSAAGGGYTLDTERPVFDAVFVVDNQRNNGGTVGGTETVLPAVADMLVHLSGDLIGDRFLEALNNAKSILKRGLTQDRLGKDMPHYSSLGLARIVLPVRRMAIEAAAVLSGDILTKLRGGAEKPSEAAVADAVRSLELEPAAMAQALGLARDEFVAGLAKAIDLRAAGATSGRIAAVSQRVAELLRREAPPDAIRLYCLDTPGKARRSVTAAQDQAQRRLSGRLVGSAESISKVLNERLAQMREAGRGLTWFSSLLGEVIEATDKNLARARQASARDRSDTAVQAEQEFQKACERLGSCPPGGVRQAAQAAATKCDDWLGKRVDLVTAQMQDLVLDDSLSKLRKIAEAAKSLAIFLGETLPAETNGAVGALCKKEEDEAAVTDIRVVADERKEYQSEKISAVREKMTADCLKDMTFELREGDLRLLCADGRKPERPLSIGPSLQPLEAARDWIEYLAGRLNPHFASHHLDNYIASDEEAGRYANACAKEAEVFVKYNSTLQLAVAGDPITIDVVVAPADSRLHAAFSRIDTAWRGQLQGLVCAQDSDPTTALVFKAEIGILGKVLQFRKDTAALAMVSMPGLWTLGQVSHSIFWRDPDRWENLRLFFLGVAAGRILRNPAPMDFGAKGHVRHVYSMNIGHGQTSSLGVGLQKAILEFLSPNSVTNRSALANWVNAPETQEVVRVVLPEVKREYAEFAQQPEEVPSAPLRTVLAFRLRDLEV